jgi:hypothetical protein
MTFLPGPQASLDFGNASSGRSSKVTRQLTRRRRGGGAFELGRHIGSPDLIQVGGMKGGLIVPVFA